MLALKICGFSLFSVCGATFLSWSHSCSIRKCLCAVTLTRIVAFFHTQTHTQPRTRPCTHIHTQKLADCPKDSAATLTLSVSCCLSDTWSVLRQTSRPEVSTTAEPPDAVSLVTITYRIANKYSAFSLKGLAESLCSPLYLSGLLATSAAAAGQSIRLPQIVKRSISSRSLLGALWFISEASSASSSCKGEAVGGSVSDWGSEVEGQLSAAAGEASVGGGRNKSGRRAGWVVTTDEEKVGGLQGVTGTWSTLDSPEWQRIKSINSFFCISNYFLDSCCLERLKYSNNNLLLLILYLKMLLCLSRKISFAQNKNKAVDIVHLMTLYMVLVARQPQQTTASQCNLSSCLQKGKLLPFLASLSTDYTKKLIY